MTDGAGEAERPAGAGRAILAGSVLLAAAWAAFRLASGFDGLYGQDAYEYLRFAGEVRGFLLGGAAPGPFFWPVVYPASAAALSLFTGSTASAAQLVSVLSLLAAFAAGAAALARRSPADARLAVVYWGVSFALAPYLVRASLASMSDLLAAAFLCAFLVFAFEWERNGRPLDLALASFFAVAAVTTRHPVGLVLAPAAAVLAVRALGRRAFAAAGLAVAAALLALSPTLLLARGGASSPLHYPGLREWSLSNAFSRTIDTPDGRESYRVPTVLFALSNAVSPGFFVLGLPLLLAVRKEDFATPLSRALAAGWLLSTAFHAGVPYHHDRHLLASFPLVPFLLFPAFARITRLRLAALPREGAVLAVALLVALQLGLAARACRAMFAANRLELEVVAALRETPAVKLYTFFLTPALASRGVPQKLVELWAAPPDDARPGDLLLFAPGRFAAQWKGRRPMTGYETLAARFDLTPLRRLGGGFTLYRLAPRPGGGAS
ncbi:MAG: hypothetical protein IPP07_05585 [Holophagales bacterium]|nr:hypothetical protein [Holophagales bacterium]MBK9964385.1 hypothetical protein [Holophagales bacterium]